MAPTAPIVPVKCFTVGVRGLLDPRLKDGRSRSDFRTHPPVGSPNSAPGLTYRSRDIA
jgi:hypothetical protein